MVKILCYGQIQSLILYERASLMMFSLNVRSLLQDERYNQYLVVEPSTKLLRVIQSEDFEASSSQFLTWFTICDKTTWEHYATRFICFHCSICVAGFPDKRLFFDRNYNIAMLLSKNTNTNRHFEIDISYVHAMAVNKSWLSCSQGDLFLRELGFVVSCENCTMLRMIQWICTILGAYYKETFTFIYFRK